MAFQRGETIVCKIEVRNAETGNLTNPSGDTAHTKISITDPAGDPAKNSGSTAVTDIAMNNDGVGLYHYDFTPNDTYAAGPPIKPVAVPGKFEIEYVATDGARVTIERDSFIVVE